MKRWTSEEKNERSASVEMEEGVKESVLSVVNPAAEARVPWMGEERVVVRPLERSTWIVKFGRDSSWPRGRGEREKGPTGLTALVSGCDMRVYPARIAAT